MANLIEQFITEAELVHSVTHLVRGESLEDTIVDLVRDVEANLIYDARNHDPIPRKELAQKVVGISEMIAGIAETGSLIVDLSSPDHLVSLLPQRHLAIIDADQIYPTFSDYLASGRALLQYTMITGPSKTADIEKILVYGAHGPVQLDILIRTG
ncbi:MAG: lactate utilization protein [Candidatus Marinimicrobia bacterium]|nr:lactate utilization protein [Candidatus Neomarinimicrobiota bacterium]